MRRRELLTQMRLLLREADSLLSAMLAAVFDDPWFLGGFNCCNQR